MREEGSNWFSKWEEELPSPDELTPLSQTLISPNLALAFDIQSSPTNLHPQTHRPTSTELESSSTGAADEPARTLKRPRLVWTPQLHKRFVDAVAHLGIRNAVPKTIMQLMSVDGLTRENVASHLQKYRLYLKRMQGIGGAAGGGSGDPATDHLFASSPVPAHFLAGGGGYVASPAALAAIHHQQQDAAMVSGRGHVGQFPSPASGAWQFENPFVSRQVQVGSDGRLNGYVLNQNSASGFVGDFESGASVNGRRVLTLFPASD